MQFSKEYKRFREGKYGDISATAFARTWVLDDQHCISILKYSRAGN